MKTNQYVPEGNDQLRTEKPYINLGKLPEGEHKFRIVQRPIGGWLEWDNKKPKRSIPSKKPLGRLDENTGEITYPKRFWAMHVWDYQGKRLAVMEVTQASILKSLESLAFNEEWGDLSAFDIKIKKEGSGKDSKYGVIPIPPKEMSQEVRAIVESTPIRLEALYEGKDPWSDLQASDALLQENRLTVSQVNRLRELCDKAPDDYVANLSRFLEIDRYEDLDPKDYERVIKMLEGKVNDVANA
jgi:hypothetical protein